MKKFAHQRPLGVAAAGMAALLLVGCGSGSGSAGTASSTAVLTGDSTGTASTTLSADDTSSTVPSPSGAQPASPIAEAELRLPNGERIGTVDFAVDGSVITITATVNNLPPGFKGFHLHSIGRCEPHSADPNDPSKTGDFLSAGGHLGAADAAHPGHRGDLTSLQVRGDGSAELVTTTDAFDMDAVLDADGSAVIVHTGPDNFANIPSRYAPSGPDAKTQATGDAGDRAACGVVRAINS
jgi:Cu-Zn family superoxide dismutase